MFLEKELGECVCVCVGECLKESMLKFRGACRKELAGKHWQCLQEGEAGISSLWEVCLLSRVFPEHRGEN